MLRLLPPELAHFLALRFMMLAPNLSQKYCYDSAFFSQEIVGLHFPNPIGLAAGLDKDAIAGLNLFRLAFGFIELGTVTPLPQGGNPKPRLFRLQSERAIINRMGFNNLGSAHMAASLQLIRQKKQVGQIIGVNIGKNKMGDLQDYLTCFLECAPYSDYVTINISSPNTPGLRDLQNPEIIKKLLSQLKELALQKNISCPIFLKLSPDLPSDLIQPLIQAVSYADALILTNTTIRREHLPAKYSQEKGGLSGAPLFDISTDILREFAYGTEGKIPLIGVGGISNAEQAYLKIKAGACLLQIYTALIYGGVTLVADILQGLEIRLKADGFAHISDAVGADL